MVDEWDPQISDVVDGNVIGGYDDEASYAMQYILQKQINAQIVKKMSPDWCSMVETVNKASTYTGKSIRLPKHAQVCEHHQS